MLKASIERGKLRFCRLSVDGRIIASSFDLLHGQEAFAMKIAHERSYNQYSPGVLLEQANLNDLMGQEIVKMIDSCAAEDHSVLNSLWTKKKEIGQILIGGRGVMSRFYIGAFLVLDRLAEAFRKLKNRD